MNQGTMRSADAPAGGSSSLASRHLAICGIAHAQGGPRTYAAELIKQLFVANGGLERLTIISDDPDHFLDQHKPEWVDGFRLNMPHPVLRPWVESRQIPRYLARKGVDLYHSTKNFLPKRLPCPAVVTIHDLAPFRLPQTFSTASGVFLRHAIRSACHRAIRIIADSLATAHDIVELLSIPREKIDVIHPGISPDLLQLATEAEKQAVRERYELHGPLILCLATIQPRKNQTVVLSAFLRAVEELPRGTTCLFVGRRGWKTAAFESMLADAGGADVRWLRSVPNQDLRGLYAITSIFASPFACEGFGLTNLEAMAQGTPVIGLRDAAVPEVLGDAALLIDRPEAELLAEGLIRLFADQALKDSLHETSRQRALSYTWEKAAAAHRKCYARVLPRSS